MEKVLAGRTLNVPGERERRGGGEKSCKYSDIMQRGLLSRESTKPQDKDMKCREKGGEGRPKKREDRDVKKKGVKAGAGGCRKTTISDTLSWLRELSWGKRTYSKA